ncbi:amidase [candidate division KSB1 bacterium]|nr:amidase [candidate division KSB1 bacterium]
MIKSSNEHSPPLRAVIACYEEDVYAQARASDNRYRRRKPLSIMDGVPVVIKDELDQVSYPTTVGTSFLGQKPATTDATVVARLRSAGALLVGKGNMHEIGIGISGNNPKHGTIRNPYHLMHYSGGSSSGPAAAVASGLCPIAIGADGGGSIRIPSSYCGIYGLKATFSRVSEYGAAPICWSVAHNGPLAATVHDLVLSYATIAGQDDNDALTRSQPPVTLPDLKSFRMKNMVLGVYWPWFRHADKAIVSACEKRLADFEQMGATIREITLPELEALRVAHTITIASEMTSAMARYYKRHRKDFNFDTRINLALARTFTARDYLLAQRLRTRAMSYFSRALEQVNAIITPATACVAPPIRKDALKYGESDLTMLSEAMRYAIAANFTGLPAITFPVDYDPNGLPIGMQAIGRPWAEDDLLAIAYKSEGLLKRVKPQMFYSILEGHP